MDARAARPEHAVQEDADEAAELLLRRLALPGPAGGVGRLAHRADRALQDLAVEAELVAEVVVHRGHVGAGGLADLAHRDHLETALAEEPLRGRKQPRAGQSVRLHSVRLKRPVARLMASRENTERNRR